MFLYTDCWLGCLTVLLLVLVILYYLPQKSKASNLSASNSNKFFLLIRILHFFLFSCRLGPLLQISAAKLVGSVLPDFRIQWKCFFHYDFWQMIYKLKVCFLSFLGVYISFLLMCWILSNAFEASSTWDMAFPFIFIWVANVELSYVFVITWENYF